MSATVAPAGTALASSQPKGRLLRILGVSFGIAVIVGDTIGSGILRTPGEIAGHLGSFAFVLTVWLLGGAYALFCMFAAVVADLKDALFTLVLIMLVCPLYFLFIKKRRVATPSILIGTNALQ